MTAHGNQKPIQIKGLDPLQRINEIGPTRVFHVKHLSFVRANLTRTITEWTKITSDTPTGGRVS